MFKGKAELDNPETNTLVATFSETCHGDGTAKMKVILKPPITISGTERLAIYSTVKNEEVISVTAKDGASTESTTSKAAVPLAALPISRISR